MRKIKIVESVLILVVLFVLNSCNKTSPFDENYRDKFSGFGYLIFLNNPLGSSYEVRFLPVSSISNNKCEIRNNFSEIKNGIGFHLGITIDNISIYNKSNKIKNTSYSNMKIVPVYISYSNALNITKSIVKNKNSIPFRFYIENNLITRNIFLTKNINIDTLYTLRCK